MFLCSLAAPRQLFSFDGVLRVRVVTQDIRAGKDAYDRWRSLSRAINMSAEHTKTAVDNYFKATQSMSVEQWVSRFADGAEVEDPIGTPVLKTKESIQTQGEQFMRAFEEVGLYPDFIQVSGYGASAKWTGRGLTKDGRCVEFEGINVWEFDEGGRVKRLIGYWNPSDMREVG